MIDLRSLSNPPLFPLHVRQDAIEAFRRTDPLFCTFLVETGRVIIVQNEIGRTGPGKGMNSRAATISY